MGIYSQADNGNYPGTCTISPETGQVSYQLPIISLSGALHTDVRTTRDITLSYCDNDAVIGQTSPYGIGWSIQGLSYVSVGSTGSCFYFTKGKYFSSPSSAQIDDDNERITFRDQKTKDVAVYYSQTNDLYTVYHKDGVVEKLTKTTPNRYSLTSLTFPGGEQFQVSYGQFGTEMSLNKITAKRGTDIDLVQMKYEQNGLLSQINVWRGTDYATADFDFMAAPTSSSYWTLNKITGFHGSDETSSEPVPKTFFYYEDFPMSVTEKSHHVLSKVTYPGGAYDSFTRDDGHRYYPDPNTGLPSFSPRVFEHYYLPGSSQSLTEIKRLFEYSPEYNFMGFPNTYWSSSEDNLYAWGTAYQYSYFVKVTTDPADETNQTVSKKTYNTFHLLKSDEQTCQECTILKEYTYPCDEDENAEKTFYEQPDNVQFATSTTWTVTDASGQTKTVTMTQTTDEYGNTTKVVSPSQMVKTIQFYDPSGEDGCPPDTTKNFARFVKSVTSTSNLDSQVSKTRTFTYVSCTPLANAPADEIPYVVKMSKLEIKGDSTLATLDFTYDENDPNSYFTHNALSSLIFYESSDGKNDKDNGDCGPKVTCSFTHEVGSSENICTTCTVTGDDGASFKTSQTRTGTTGAVVQKTDRNGIVTTGKYSLSGKLIDSTTAVDEAEERKTTYTYAFDEEDLSTVVRTDANGVKTRLTYNHSGKVVKAELAAPSSETYPQAMMLHSRPDPSNLLTFLLSFCENISNGFHSLLRSFMKSFSKVGATNLSTTTPSWPTDYLEVYSQAFDSFGRESSETVTDYGLNEDGTVYPLCQTVTTKEYDGWGLVCKQSRSNGVVETITNDVVNLQRISCVQTVDSEDKEKVTASLNSKTITYNLFKTIDSISESTPDGGATLTSFSYDGLGRKLSATSPLGNKMQINSYDVFDRPTEFTMADETVIALTYCETSPHQLVTSMDATVGDAKKSLASQTFDGISRKTSKTVAGCKTSFEYDGGLGNASTITTGAGSTISVTYKPGLVSMPDNVEMRDGGKGTATDADEYSKFTYGTDWAKFNLGRLTKAENGYQTSEWTYSNNGAELTCTSSDTASGTVTSKITNHLSLFGKSIQSDVNCGSDVNCEQVKYVSASQYDSYGNLTKKTQEGVEVDINGNLMEKTQEAVGVDLEYDGFGRVVKETVCQAAKQIQVTEFTYDICSREVSRTVKIIGDNGSSLRKFDYEYNVENKVTRRTLTVENTVVAAANYGYDSLNRLTSYEVDEGYDRNYLATPGMGIKLGIIGQTFTYDSFSNIECVTTTFCTADGTEVTDTATWTYEDETSIAFRPSSITHSLTSYFPPKFSLTYDLNGNLTDIMSSVGSIVMTYSVIGRLLTYTGEDGVKKSFTYDQFSQQLTDTSTRKCYNKGEVMYEQGMTPADGSVTYFGIEDHKIGETSIMSDGTTPSYTKIVSDRSNSAVFSNGKDGISYQPYTPYGASDSVKSHTGFGGMLRSAGTGGYFPGNGTRFYLPSLGMFTSIDTMSPFGGGGIHPYIYCKGDPVNSHDRTGHWSAGDDLAMNIACLFLDIVLLGVSVATMDPFGVAGALSMVSGVFGITSDSLGIAADSLSIEGSTNDKAIQKLGFASSILGVASLATGVGSSAAEVYKLGDNKAAKGMMNVAGVDDDSAVKGLTYKSAVEFDDGHVLGGSVEPGSAMSVPDKSILRSKPAEMVLTSLAGVDFEAIDKVCAKGGKTATKVLYGGRQAMSLADQAMGYTLFAEGTWSPHVPDKPESVMDQTNNDIKRKSQQTSYHHDGNQSRIHMFLLEKLPFM